MNDQGFGAIQIDKQVFRPPPQLLHLTAGEPLGEVRRQRDTQIRAARLHARQAMARQDGLEAPSNGFDLWKFRHARKDFSGYAGIRCGYA